MTLDDVKAFIQAESKRLDPESRYISELLERVNLAQSVGALESLLADSRGAFWAGHYAWNRMTLKEKLRANLITNETSMMRFETEEMRCLRSRVIPFLRFLAKHRPPEILSLPCSHGEESVSLAIEFKENGLQDFTISGYDIQRASIEVARSGKIPISGMPRYVTATVAPEIMRHLVFEEADVFAPVNDASPQRVYDLVVCRNFLGYFTPDVAKQVLDKLWAMTEDPGMLFLDSFVIGKHPELFDRWADYRFPRLPFFLKNTNGDHEANRFVNAQDEAVASPAGRSGRARP